MLEDSTTGWILLERSYNFRGEYDGSVDYLPGDLVRRGGHTYIAIRTVPGVPGPSDDSTTVNTLNYLDTDLWEKVTDAQKFRGNWITNTNYNIGGFDPTIMLPDEDVYKPKKKDTKDTPKGLENFMEMDD